MRKAVKIFCIISVTLFALLDALLLFLLAIQIINNVPLDYWYIRLSLITTIHLIINIIVMKKTRDSLNYYQKNIAIGVLLLLFGSKIAGILYFCWDGYSD